MSAPIPEKIRVGLFVDSRLQPYWIAHAIKQVANSAHGEIVLLMELPLTGHQQSRSRLGTVIRELLFSAYVVIDRRCFATAPDPTARSDITPLLQAAETLTAHSYDAITGFRAEDKAAVQKAKLDVALWLTSLPPTGEFSALARYGLWRFFFGGAPSADGRLAGFWEVMRALPQTFSGIGVFTGNANEDAVIYLSSARTFPFSFRRNQENVLRKTAEFAFRKIRDLHRLGPDALRPVSEERSGWPIKLPGNPPGNMQIAGLLTRLLSRIGRRAIQKLFFVDQWVLAYRFGNPGDVLSTEGFVSLLPPKDRFWADPFPIEKDGRYYIFFEELMFDTGKGHISVLEINESGRATVPVKVLQGNHHLSYPFIFEWEGVLYMIPETGEKRTVELYRCVSFPDQWVFDRVLIANLRAVDATLYQRDGRWWMFVNVSPDGVEIFDELHLYYADTPFGPWLPHDCNPVISDVMRARPAGALFKADEEIIRLSQVCAPIYGAGLSFSKIVRITPQEYAEREVQNMIPLGEAGYCGVHTRNRAGQLEVIDGFVRRSRILTRKLCSLASNE